MARRRFKSHKKESRYGHSRSRSNNSRKLLFFALAVIIVGIIGIQMMGNDEVEEPTANPNTTDPIIDDIISEINEGTSDSGPDTDIANEPEDSGEPEVNPNPTPVVEDIAFAGVDNAEAEKLMIEAKKDIDAGKIIAARDKLNSVLELKISSGTQRRIKAMMAALSERWLFSREMYADDELTETYLVQSGENFEGIGRRFLVPPELLMQINNIKIARNLPANKNIKIVKGPFNVVVHRDSSTMDIYLQRTYVRSYNIGTGRAGHETPIGKWQVKSGGKLKDKPDWTDPDTGIVYTKLSPDYPLGERWIAIKGLDEKTKLRTGFAFHGTKDPESIRKRSSRGCIRLYNGDVVELYNMLVSTHSKVNILAD